MAKRPTQKPDAKAPQLVPIQAFVKPETLEALKLAAVEENRPFSNLVRYALEQWLDQREMEMSEGFRAGQEAGQAVADRALEILMKQLDLKSLKPKLLKEGKS